MPTVSVGRDRLFAALGETYSELSSPTQPCLRTIFVFLISHCFVFVDSHSAGRVRGPLLQVRNRARRRRKRFTLFASFFFFFLYLLLILKFEIIYTSFWLFQTTEKAIIRKEKHLEEEEGDEDEEVIYKIEVPANRYFTI